MPSLFKSTLNTRPLQQNSYRYIRSDAPLQLSPRELQFLIEQHITTIIDLRTEEEALKNPCPLKDEKAFQYRNMPVSGGNAVPVSQEAVSKSYCDMVDYRMAEIISCIEHAETNVLFFCSAGKDRTGVVSALLLRRLGASDEDIIADYLLSAENLKGVLQKYASAQGIDINIITPQRKYMEEFLSFLNA